MSKIRIKICGLLNIEDAIYAANLGVDALGFVFYKKSPRYINPKTVAEIVKQLPPFVTCVGLFVNHTKEEVDEILRITPLDVLQFHGDEENLFCNSFDRPFIKAIRVSQNRDIQTAVTNYKNARAILFDAFQENLYGGTGQVFDWNILNMMKIPLPWILSGGLNPENIKTAIQTTKTLAVDVSGGVESTLGVKSQLKIKHFIDNINNIN